MTVKSRILEMLEEHKGEVLSGEGLAGQLGCTRAAVWKAVKALREEGYNIDAGTNRGYILESDTHRISAEKIRLYLDNPYAKIQIYNETKSTNSSAMEAAVRRIAGHGDFTIARSQKEGRGRSGKEFYSPADAGIYLSVILKPEAAQLQGSMLLTAAGVTAVYRAVKKVCRIDLDIKWANDLYFHGKKVGGILTEAVADCESGSIEAAVIGIGLNLYQRQEGFPGELSETAGALFQTEEQAQKVDRNRLVAELVNELMKEAADLKLSGEYIKRNVIPGHTIKITDRTGTRKAFAMSVCPDGRLLVKEINGKKSEISYAEVSLA